MRSQVRVKTQALFGITCSSFDPMEVGGKELQPRPAQVGRRQEGPFPAGFSHVRRRMSPSPTRAPVFWLYPCWGKGCKEEQNHRKTRWAPELLPGGSSLSLALLPVLFMARPASLQRPKPLSPHIIWEIYLLNGCLHSPEGEVTTRLWQQWESAGTFQTDTFCTAKGAHSAQGCREQEKANRQHQTSSTWPPLQRRAPPPSETWGGGSRGSSSPLGLKGKHGLAIKPSGGVGKCFHALCTMAVFSMAPS